MRRLILPVLIGLLASAGYFALNFYELNRDVIRLSAFPGGSFFPVLATLYAIVTALLLVKGIETFNALGRAINREAMRIRSINTYLSYFDAREQQGLGSDIARFRALLSGYAANVLMQGSARPVAENESVIDDCILLTARLTVADENDRIALGEIMRGLDGLRDLRAERIHYGRRKIPNYLIRMLALMTAAIMAPFYFFHTPGPDLNYYVIFVIGAFGSFIYFLLNDINRPYRGLWKVDFSAFEQVLADIEKRGGA